MDLAIETEAGVEGVALEGGSASIGGGSGDTLHIEGLAEGLLELRADPLGIEVRGRESVLVGSAFTPPLVWRWWLPDEAIALGRGVLLRQRAAPVRRVGTATLLRGLLSAETDPELPLPRLACLTGLDRGRRHPLPFGATTLGRGADVEVRLRERTVSRRHAQIVRTKDALWLEDLGSPNGTYVNGERVVGRIRLPDDAVLELGHTLVRLESAQERPPPQAEPSPPPSPVPLERLFRRLKSAVARARRAPAEAGRGDGGVERGW
jgi:hypothetical protein